MSDAISGGMTAVHLGATEGAISAADFVVLPAIFVHDGIPLDHNGKKND